MCIHATAETFAKYSERTFSVDVSTGFRTPSLLPPLVRYKRRPFTFYITACNILLVYFPRSVSKKRGSQGWPALNRVEDEAILSKISRFSIHSSDLSAFRFCDAFPFR